MKKLMVILSVLLCLSAAIGSQAETSFLTNTLSPETLRLDCDWLFNTSTGRYDITYTLTNTLANDTLRAFTLTLPDGFFTADLTNIIDPVAPVAWTHITSANQVMWSVIDDELPVGASAVFGFSTLWEPAAMTMNASAVDTFGFSGVTCGPVIPEASTVMLAVMGLGSVAGLRRFYKK